MKQMIKKHLHDSRIHSSELISISKEYFPKYKEAQQWQWLGWGLREEKKFAATKVKKRLLGGFNDSSPSLNLIRSRV